jgi:ankyrin repeat protein
MNELEQQNKQLPNSEPLSVKRRHGSLRNSFSESNLPDEQRLMLAAGRGEIEIIRHFIAKNSKLLKYSDENYWQPLHEAVRAGSIETVEYLIDHGADMGWRVKGGRTALAIALESLPEEHEVVQYLKSIGAPAE